MTNLTINITDRLPTAELLSLQEYEHIDHLWIGMDNNIDKKILDKRLITTDVTRCLKNIKSLQSLTIWQTMTRTALRDCFEINGLEELTLLGLVSPGKLVYSGNATTLKRVNNMMSSETDLRIFLNLPNLTELKAHSSDWSIELLDKVANKTTLTRLETEGSRLNQRMIKAIAHSKTIEHLDIGDSGLTGIGLANIVQMQQLTSLDIWNTRVTANDLALLQQLPNLTYLSIGGYAGQKYMNIEEAIPHLLALPELKQLWIDNLYVTDEQLTRLKQQIETVRYDFYDYFEEENP